MTRNTPLKKYIFIFAGANLAMMVIAAVVFTLLDMDANAGVNMGILIGSAMAAGHYFLKDHNRLPTASEKRRLVFMSFLASVLVSLLFALSIVIVEPGGVALVWMTLQEQALIFLTIMLIVSVVYLLVLWLGYGFMLSSQLKAMQKKAASDRAN